MKMPKMKLASLIDSVKLALLSLPLGSSFQIIAYGDHFEWLGKF